MPDETFAPDPQARTHWELRHRIVETPGIEVTSQWIDDETEVRREAFRAVAGGFG